MTTNLARPKQEVTVSARFSGEFESRQAWTDTYSAWLLVTSAGKTVASKRLALGTVAPGGTVRVELSAAGARRTANRLDTYTRVRVIVCRSGLPMDPDTGEPGNDSIYLDHTYLLNPRVDVSLAVANVYLRGTLTSDERSTA